VRGLSPQTLKAALLASQWEWVVLAVAVVVGSGVLKAIRWRALFFPQRMGLGKVWRVLMIGQMLNVVLFARAGEIGRIYLIGEVGEVHRAKALSTVVVEKMVDLVMLALAFLLVAIWLMTPLISSDSISSIDPIGAEDWLQRAGAVLLPIAVLALGGLLLLAYGGRPVWQFLRRIVNPLSLRWRTAAAMAIDQAIAGFEALRHWQTGAQVWGLSLAIWALATLTNLLLFNAFQLSLSGSIPLWRDPRNGIDLWCRIAVGGEPSATRVGIGIHALGKLVSAALLFGGGAKQDAIASETKATKEQGLFSKARWSDMVGYKPGSVEVLRVRVRELNRSDVLAQVIFVMGSARRAQVMYVNA
jgi:hypothetical protein